MAPKGRLLSRNPSVERTFSLPSNPTTSSSFLLPSYPLATLPGGMLTPTPSRRHADSSLSMSNTWPNKKDNSPQQRETSPWRETASAAKGNLVGKRDFISYVFVCDAENLFIYFLPLWGGFRVTILSQMTSLADALPDLFVPPS